MLEPPCTTYSIIRRPALRSKMVPYGFQPREPKTRLGNQLAGRACQVFYVAAINHVAALLETTYSSLLKHLPFWKSAAGLPGARQTRVDSCRFGSPHLKSFRMLSVHVRPDHMDKRCQCTKPHLQVQGKYTKASATYTDLLAEAIALDFERWIRSEKVRVAEEACPDSKGLESVGIDNLAISGDWSVDTAWTFRKESHINILEEAVVLRLAQRCSKFGFPTRVTAMVDSNVVRGATSKGRSSSISLSAVLRRFNAICVAAALYFNIPFCPTRLNVADDPTRDRPLRSKSPGVDLSKLSRDELFDIFSHHKLKRWAANWARLIIRMCGVKCLDWSKRDVCRRRWASNIQHFVQMDFDSTLGFPGEGPPRRPPRFHLGPSFALSALSLLFVQFGLGFVASFSFCVLVGLALVVSPWSVFSSCPAVSRLPCSCCLAPWQCL